MSAPPLDPNQLAAHQLLTELRTRISTQPLPYRYGVEADALRNLWEVFDQARAAIKANPGCEQFAARTTTVLNTVLRPLTAKWHRALEDGRLNGRDGADAFRGELQQVQARLREFAAELHEMACGRAHTDELTPEVMTPADLDALFQPLEFRFTAAPGADLKGRETDIARSERAAVAARRKKKQIATADGRDAIGLALSGGGIRSATFSLGVVQVLAERGFLKEVDFLSTVSGGGYTGCFLTQQLGAGEDQSAIAGPRGPDPAPVRYVRQHARFLSAGNLREKWGMVTATFAGMVLNWTAPLLVVLVLALIASQSTDAFAGLCRRGFIAAGALSVAAMVAYGCGVRRGRKAGLATGAVLGVLLALTALLGAVWLLDPFLTQLVRSAPDRWRNAGGWGRLAAVVAAGSAMVPGILRFIPVFENPKWRKLVLQVALGLAGLLVPVGALLGFYVFREVAGGHFALVAAIAAACAVVSLFVLNINLTGPHRLYRDSLARTFIQRSEAGAPDVRLADVNPQDTGPYHLINAALNVPASTRAALKDRGCDFFLFSKHWMGSVAAGYHPTRDWKANGTDIDLATAMAVSGAAFSSYMGLGSKPALTSLLTFLNVRLGFWIRKPASRGVFRVPGFACLLREMTGFGMKESAAWLNLSDGGHIENLAVYELLRRRCKFIICVDGEADPDFTFHGLMTLVRHAQIDFGIRIEARLDDIRPDPATGLSKAHFHLCRIHYPEGIGLLLYLKLSRTGNESELIRRYRTINPGFPHQPTLDQFFDQEQFEAYRQLGVHVAESHFLPALMSGVSPRSVPEWFRRLAKSLLEPEGLRVGVAGEG